MSLHSGCPAEDITLNAHLVSIYISLLFLEVFEDLSGMTDAQHPGLHGVEGHYKCLVFTSQPRQTCSTLLLARGGRLQLPLISAFSTRLSKGRASFPTPAALKSKFLLLDLLFIAWLPSTLPHHLATRASSRLKGRLAVQLALLLGRASSVGSLMSPIGELIQPGLL